MPYFDNAATTYPKPECVYTFMDKFYRENGGNAGRGDYAQAMKSGELISKTRERIRELLHCPAKQVVFEPTATISINIILQGLIETGVRNVYISPFEHNAVTRVLYHYSEKAQINVIKLKVSDNLIYDLPAIRYQFDDVRPDLVVISHASNVIGLVAPVEGIFSLAKKYGAITVTDMSQTCGLIDFNAGLDTVDFVVFAGHKTMYGPTGISGFVMNPDIELPAVLFGGTGYESANQEMPKSLPQKFEAGTLNISGIAGLYAALGWLRETSLPVIWAKEQEHREKLIDILKQHDFIRIMGAFPERKYVGIVSCVIDGVSSDTAGSLFSENGISVRTGLHCAPMAHKFLGTYPAGTIRFSVSYFTSDDDYFQLNDVLDYLGENL